MKLLKFILFFIPFLISGFIFKYDSTFYSNLSKPSFTLPSVFFSIFWIIIFILICITIVIVSSKESIFKNKDYFYSLLSVYFSIYAFNIMFWFLKSPIFGFILSICTFITSIIFYKETKRIINKSSLLLLPFILQTIYAVILSGFIFFMNF